MFPSESTESEAAQPAAAALDILEQDQFRPSTQWPLPPTRYHARQSTNHRLVVVCMIAVSVLVLLGRSALLRRSEVPARSSDVSVSATATSRTLENPSVPQLPSSPAKQSRVVGNLSDRTSIGRGRSAPSPSPTYTTASRKSSCIDSSARSRVFALHQPSCDFPRGSRRNVVDPTPSCNRVINMLA